jgi:hypothetical protein
MKPADAFQYLYEKKLPLIISFPIEEERGHFIIGRGLCYIEKIYGTSKLVLSRFSPYRALSCIRNNGGFHAHFDINGQSFGCCFDDVLIDSRKLITEIPANLYPYLRQYLRIEPSAKLPVSLYLFSPQYGTVSLTVRNISEHGAGVLSPIVLNINEHVICGLNLPFQGETFILFNASIVSVQETSRFPSIMNKHPNVHMMPRDAAQDSILFGLEFFPHATDANKIRMYIMQREIEIRKLLQEL